MNTNHVKGNVPDFVYEGVRYHTVSFVTLCTYRLMVRSVRYKSVPKFKFPTAKVTVANTP